MHGLEGTLCVNVNVVIEFIYTWCKSKCIRPIYIYVSVEHRSCKCKYDFTLPCKRVSKHVICLGRGRGVGFRLFLVINQPKWPITTKKKPLKHVCFGVHDNQLNLIWIIARNKLLSSPKPKMVMNKIKNSNSTQAMKWSKMCIRMCIQNIL
jgi:hypothetical protein